MNVYTCKFPSAYGFCVSFLIVAANSEEEACHTAMKCKQDWLYYYGSDYLRKKIRLLPNVTADVDESQILDENDYEE